MTDAFDPFDLTKPVQEIQENPGRDIMQDRQGFLDSENTTNPYYNEQGEYPVDVNPEDIAEGRRITAAQVVSNTFQTNNVQDLLAALSGVHDWLAGSQEAAPASLPADHPVSGASAPGRPQRAGDGRTGPFLTP